MVTRRAAHHRAKSEMHAYRFGWPSSKIKKNWKGDQPAKSLALHSPRTNSSPLKIGRAKRKFHLPTTTFQVLLLLVSGSRVHCWRWRIVFFFFQLFNLAFFRDIFLGFFLLRLRGEDVPLRPGSSGCVEDVDKTNWIQMQQRLQRHFFFVFQRIFWSWWECQGRKRWGNYNYCFSKDNLLGPWFLGWLNDSWSLFFFQVRDPMPWWVRGTQLWKLLLFRRAQGVVSKRPATSRGVLSDTFHISFRSLVS